MSLRKGNIKFTTGTAQSSVLQSDDTYTVTTVLSWAPDITDNNQFLYCDVQHQQTQGNSLQTTSLLLKVNGIYQSLKKTILIKVKNK